MTNPLKPQKSKEFILTRRIMADYVLMLSALSLVSVITYGGKAAMLIAVSVLTSLICRRLGGKLLHSEEPVGDLSSVATGMMTALLLPVTAGWWMAVCASFFAVTVCVLPFGVTRRSPFVPAAGAVCFASLCWKDRMFMYPDTGLGSYFKVYESSPSLTEMLAHSNSIGRNPAAVLEIITGNMPSAMGAGCVIALVGALVYLIIRRPKNAVPSLTFILSAALTALAFPRVNTGRLSSLIMELCGGMLLFAAVFFMSYPSVLPARIVPRALWGFAGGIICMLARYFGFLEESVCFGILIIDALSELFDRLPPTLGERKKVRETAEYVEIPATVVPEEILNEIPDAPEKEEEELPPEPSAESLDSVISEENTVTDREAPFITGGDGDE